ncbi:Beta,beta-carotene 15,15'-monooxygenase [Zootermopsis nevadensis]|uniref:Beta,beta-carotene 15,15'-monooxygenase n=1 Tax=Zootermopsis nevadensis TaxID=136037 RepID=A0A067RCL6_ZOONE|nr:Beta,beta-carotene 15,15'-monooxygenase [Zootermopsis nevadensis]
METVADVENNNCTSVSNSRSTPVHGWWAPVSGWVTSLCGRETTQSEGGRNSARRRQILAGNHKDKTYLEGSSSGRRTGIECVLRDDGKAAESRVKGVGSISPGLDLGLLKKLEAGKDLYPSCDTSVWLRSCSQEVVEPLEGRVTGCIPKWLKGSLIRNGPGNLKVGDMTFGHLFDGSALLHRLGMVLSWVFIRWSRTYE